MWTADWQTQGEIIKQALPYTDGRKDLFGVRSVTDNIRIYYIQRVWASLAKSKTEKTHDLSSQLPSFRYASSKSRFLKQMTTRWSDYTVVWMTTCWSRMCRANSHRYRQVTVETRHNSLCCQGLHPAKNVGSSETIIQGITNIYLCSIPDCQAELLFGLDMVSIMTSFPKRSYGGKMQAKENMRLPEHGKVT